MQELLDFVLAKILVQHVGPTQNLPNHVDVLPNQFVLLVSLLHLHLVVVKDHAHHVGPVDLLSLLNLVGVLLNQFALLVW